MNDLSWLILLGEVVEKVSVALTLFPALVLMLMSIVQLYHYTERYTTYFRLRTFIAILCVFMVGVAIPSKQTIYMIAASEVTGNVVSSPEGKEVLNLLKEELKKSIISGGEK